MERTLKTPNNQTGKAKRHLFLTLSPTQTFSAATIQTNEKNLRPYLGLKAGKSPRCIPLPSQERLHYLFNSNPDESDFTCRVARGCHIVGDVMGSPSDGYVNVLVDYTMFRLHRLKWKYHYGKDPNGPLDHINGNRSDNRLSNLRESDPLQNSRNRHKALSNTNIIGVSYCKGARRYKASIGAGNKIIHLGTFVALECAVAARKHAEAFLFNAPAQSEREAA